MIIESLMWAGAGSGVVGTFFALNHLGNKRLETINANKPQTQTKASTKHVVKENFDFICVGNTKSPKIMQSRSLSGKFGKNPVTFERMCQFANDYFHNMSQYQCFLIRGEFDESTQVTIMSYEMGKYLHVKMACHYGIAIYCNIDTLELNQDIVITINNKVYTSNIYDIWRKCGVHEIKLKHTPKSNVKKYDDYYHVKESIKIVFGYTHEKNNASYAYTYDEQPTTPVSGHYISICNDKSYVKKYGKEYVDEDTYTRRLDSTLKARNKLKAQEEDEYHLTRLLDW